MDRRQHLTKPQGSITPETDSRDAQSYMGHVSVSSSLVFSQGSVAEATDRDAQRASSVGRSFGYGTFSHIQRVVSAPTPSSTPASSSSSSGRIFAFGTFAPSARILIPAGSNGPGSAESDPASQARPSASNSSSALPTEVINGMADARRSILSLRPPDPKMHVQDDDDVYSGIDGDDDVKEVRLPRSHPTITDRQEKAGRTSSIDNVLQRGSVCRHAVCEVTRLSNLNVHDLRLVCSAVQEAAHGLPAERMKVASRASKFSRALCIHSVQTPSLWELSAERCQIFLTSEIKGHGEGLSTVFPVETVDAILQRGQSVCTLRARTICLCRWCFQAVANVGNSITNASVSTRVLMQAPARARSFRMSTLLMRTIDFWRRATEESDLNPLSIAEFIPAGKDPFWRLLFSGYDSAFSFCVAYWDVAVFGPIFPKPSTVKKALYLLGSSQRVRRKLLRDLDLRALEIPLLRSKNCTEPVPLRLRSHKNDNFKECKVCALYKAERDAAPANSPAKKEAVEKLRIHVNWMMEERATIEQIKVLAVKDSARVGIYLMDGASTQGTVVPWYQRSDGDYMSQHVVLGIAYVPLGKYGNTTEKLLKSYIFYDHLGPGGGDETIEHLLRHVNSLYATDLNRATWPTKYYIVVDGSSDNKNRSVLALCALWVEVGLFEEVLVFFLPVGHTHNEVDGLGGVVSIKKRSCKLLSPQEWTAYLEREIHTTVETVYRMNAVTDFFAAVGASSPTLADFRDVRSFKFVRVAPSIVAQFNIEQPVPHAALHVGARSSVVMMYRSELQDRLAWSGDPQVAGCCPIFPLPFRPRMEIALKPISSPGWAKMTGFYRKLQSCKLTLSCGSLVPGEPHRLATLQRDWADFMQKITSHVSGAPDPRCVSLQRLFDAGAECARHYVTGLLRSAVPRLAPLHDSIVLCVTTAVTKKNSVRSVKPSAGAKTKGPVDGGSLPWSIVDLSMGAYDFAHHYQPSNDVCELCNARAKEQFGKDGCTITVAFRRAPNLDCLLCVCNFCVKCLPLVEHNGTRLVPTWPTQPKYVELLCKAYQQVPTCALVCGACSTEFRGYLETCCANKLCIKSESEDNSGSDEGQEEEYDSVNNSDGAGAGAPDSGDASDAGTRSKKRRKCKE